MKRAKQRNIKYRATWVQRFLHRNRFFLALNRNLPEWMK